jgi:hypothetical protein
MRFVVVFACIVPTVFRPPGIQIVVIRDVGMQVVVAVLVQQDQATRSRRPQKRHDDQRSGQPAQDLSQSRCSPSV